MKMADRLGAAPSELSFGDSVARAGARPMENWCDPRAGPMVAGSKDRGN